MKHLKKFACFVLVHINTFGLTFFFCAVLHEATDQEIILAPFYSSYHLFSSGNEIIFWPPQTEMSPQAKLAIY